MWPIRAILFQDDTKCPQERGSILGEHINNPDHMSWSRATGTRPVLMRYQYTIYKNRIDP